MDAAGSSQFDMAGLNPGPTSKNQSPRAAPPLVA